MIDRVNDSSFKKMIDLIVSKLKDRGIDNIYDEKGKQFNIALIHNQKYCKNNKIPDQHVSDLNSNISLMRLVLLEIIQLILVIILWIGF